MKLNKAEALRWLDQAEHNLEVTRSNFRGGFHSDVCFMSEQTAQVALKAFIIFHGKRYIWEHSVQELARISSGYDKDFNGMIDGGKLLDRYYIPTRYPDALASPAVPHKTFMERDALDAMSIAERVMELVKRKIG